MPMPVILMLFFNNIRLHREIKTHKRYLSRPYLLQNDADRGPKGDKKAAINQKYMYRYIYIL